MTDLESFSSLLKSRILMGEVAELSLCLSPALSSFAFHFQVKCSPSKAHAA